MILAYFGIVSILWPQLNPIDSDPDPDSFLAAFILKLELFGHIKGWR